MAVASDRVIMVAYEGAQTLDLTGPAEVFAGACRQIGDAQAYRTRIASVGGGALRTSSGCVVASMDLRRLRPRPRDTVLVVGADEEGILGALDSAALAQWLVRAAPVVRRIGSVCSGAIILANTGILDGRPAATHWSACDRLAAFRPAVRVDRNAIFVQDGRVWTSAGVTTGIDMALAMVEEDHGRAVADAIAARLVLYARRPGFQSQFSDALIAQTAASDPLGSTLAWARRHLRDLDVDRLAKRAGMSARTLHRRCLEHLSTTPAKLIQALRVEHARTLVATASLPLKIVAHAAGFANVAQMRRAFSCELGLGPAAYRLLFGR